MDSAAQSVGLAGDGDEIWAIEDVERAFGITFNSDDAPNWITAGDLFASLKEALPEGERTSEDLWERFAIALSQETGVDANLLKPESPLILEGHPWRRIIDFAAWSWIAIFLIVAFVAVAALFGL